MEESKIGERRFTIFSLLLLTAFVAALVATDLGDLALGLLVFVGIPLLVLRVLVHCVYRLQLVAANRLTPFFYSHGMFRLVRFFCGRPYAAWALNNYANKLFSDRQYQSAIEAYSTAIELHDTSAHYWAHRGASKYELGQHDAAIEDLSTALKLDHTHEIALVYRGYSLTAIEDYPAALNDLAGVECTHSKHSSVAYFRGHLRERFHQWELAFDDYLLASRLDTSEPNVGIALARLQAGCPVATLRNADKAVENANNMCLRTNWNDWVAISVLGAAYAEAGDFDKAIKYAQMALELAPDDEKPERRRRIAQFRDHQPFRIPPTDPTTGLEIDTT